MSKIESFIQEQVAPSLRDGEQLRSMAYLRSAPGGGVIGGLRAKAWFGALTDQRLLLIKTRVGAFKPLLENHGVETFERTQLEGVHVGGNQVSIAIRDGKPLVFVKDRSTKKVASQAAFLDELAEQYGGNAAAAELKKKQRWKTVLGIAIAFAVIGIGAYRQCSSRVRVQVLCRVAAPNVECTAEHTQGDNAVTACWNVVFQCANGVRPSARACAEVRAGSPTTKVLSEKDFAGVDKCDKATAIDVTNLEIDE